MFKKFLRNEKGFTMIEMMVVLIIIAVLIAGGIKAYQGYINNAKITKAKAAIVNMQAALDAYYVENSKYPDTADLAGVNTSITDPWGGKYTYTRDVSDNTKYTLESSAFKIGDADYIVKGTGDHGVSEPPNIVKK